VIAITPWTDKSDDSIDRFEALGRWLQNWRICIF